MASNLIRFASHEAENQLELSLRQAFYGQEPNLRPPFPLTIPTFQEYLNLNRAILYGVLTEPHYAKVHMKHLHGIVTDGYAFFLSLNVQVVNELFEKLVDSARNQVIWVTRELVDVFPEGFSALLVSLLRQIAGGDFSSVNMWLCFEMVNLFLDKWSCLLEEEPMSLNSGLYTFLRLLSDHCRFSGDAKLEELVSLEIHFCTRMFTEQFQLCLQIGRDLIRLLQDLVHVPQFQAFWKDLILNPTKFGTPGFSDISRLYNTRTSSHYFLLRISPEMEAHLRFLLIHVKFGSQKRHQTWFFSKYLCTSERETVICDIVRFICCGHHPVKEVIQSDIIPRWAVIGWLLKSCRRNYVEANVKLALFYDWLFFDERVDKLMNIEPAMLLMESSILRYTEITNSLLEFLFLLVDNYDMERKEIISKGVSSSFRILLSKGVIQKLDMLTSSDGIPLLLRQRLDSILLDTKIGIPKELHPMNISGHCVPPLTLPKLTLLETQTPSPQRLSDIHKTDSGPISVDSLVTCCTPGAVASRN